MRWLINNRQDLASTDSTYSLSRQFLGIRVWRLNDCLGVVFELIIEIDSEQHIITYLDDRKRHRHAATLIRSYILLIAFQYLVESPLYIIQSPYRSLTRPTAIHQTLWDKITHCSYPVTYIWMTMTVKESIRVNVTSTESQMKGKIH